GFPLAAAADVANRRLAAAFDTVVCASSFAAEEWRRVAVEPTIVPLGVDLDTFHPGAAAGSRWPRGHAVELAYVGRLSTEKRPDAAVEAVARLVAGGIDARLTVAGAGPARARLEGLARRRGAPVRFAGLAGREEVA